MRRKTAARHAALPLVVLALLLALGAGAPAWAVAPEEVPNPRTQGGWVTDLAGVLTTEETARLNQVIADLERDTGAEIAVVTVTDTGDRVPKEFATDLLNRWGVGKREEDNGVLVLLAVGPRRVEVETGYGIEPILPDGRVGAILDRYAVPYFRTGDYGSGLVQAVAQMAQVIRDEYAREGAPPAAPPGEPAPARPEAGSPAEQLSLWTVGALLASLLSLWMIGRRGAASGTRFATRAAPLLPALLAVVMAGAPLALGRAASWGMLLGAVLILALAFLYAGQPLLAGLSPTGRTATLWAGQIGYLLAALVLGSAAAATGFVSLVLFAGLALAGWLVLRGTARRLPRACPQCGRPMRWLDERQEDAYLRDAQTLEEDLGSVDYDVWHCDACGETEVVPHRKTWSGYEPCPRCGYRTLGTERVTVQTPTYYRSGRERITQRCRNCSLTRSYERRLPPRTPPPVIVGGGWGGGGGRSGGFGGGGGGFGGGFGGGGSGGGGAGRGW